MACCQRVGPALGNVFCRRLGLVGIGLIGLFAWPAAVEAGGPPFEVRFRLMEWRTMHFEVEAEAERHLSAVQRLGCEAQRRQHNGHVDVRYRCLKWTRIELPSDEEAHQWIRWLRSVGFQTQHEH